jgi:predicted oxidoreductase (fatty acid repression mutant protein)
MSTRFIVEYNPSISTDGRDIIEENVVAAMENRDGCSYQYEISQIIDCVGNILSTQDYKVIKQLRDEKVDYIEIDLNF